MTLAMPAKKYATKCHLLRKELNLECLSSTITSISTSSPIIETRQTRLTTRSLYSYGAKPSWLVSIKSALNLYQTQIRWSSIAPYSPSSFTTKQKMSLIWKLAKIDLHTGLNCYMGISRKCKTYSIETIRKENPRSRKLWLLLKTT